MHDPTRPDRLTPAAALLADGLGSIAGDLGRIVAAWPAIVGDRLARVSTPSRLRDGTLSVRCASASWAHSLNGNELELLDRVAATIGPGVVTRVVARAGGPAPRIDPPVADPTPLPPLPWDQQQRLLELVATIADPAMRERLLHAAIATQQRRARDAER